MSQALRHRRHLILTDLLRWFGSALAISDRVLVPSMELVRRITIGQIFLSAAIMKYTDWARGVPLPDESTTLGFFNGLTYTYVGVGLEILAAVLLMAGLMTRLAAFSLLWLALIAQVASQESNAQVFFIILFGYWCVNGAGRQSLDYVLRGMRDTALPLAKFLGNLFAFLSTRVRPLYLVFMRVWIAAVLYIAGHSAMETMNLVPSLTFLTYHPQHSVLRMMDDHLWTTLITGVGALCIALGFATRFFSLTAFAVLAHVTHQIDATAAQNSEFVYWIMLLTILFFAGPGKYSLDHVIRRAVATRFPQLDGQPMITFEGLPHVVIVGAGFGGIATAMALRTTACRVTLIDKHNYHLFQPLLYQVATAGLSPSDIATPIRSVFRDQENIRVMLHEVTGVDKQTQRVLLRDAEPLAYDYLVLATGARHSYFGKDEWAQFAPGMKRIEDAIAVRAKLLKAFEAAENTDDPVRRDALLSFVIVGGGPTGVELAGALAELAHQGMADEFRRIDPASAKIHLIEAGPRLLAAFPESLSAYTKSALEKLGVTVLVGGRVETIDAQGVVVSGQRIASANVFWAAGVQASPAAQWLGGEADRAGRLKVARDFSVPGAANVYAIGDTVLADVWQGKPMPGLAPAAKQSGKFVAKHIRARIEGATPNAEFVYRHMGSLATIGRSAAVVDFGKLRMHGPLAWWFWGAVHVLFLANLQSRLAVVFEWCWAYLTYKRSTRLITESTGAN